MYCVFIKNYLKKEYNLIHWWRFNFLPRPMFKDFFAFLAQYNIFGIAIWLLIATKVWTLIKGLIEDLITPLILQPILKKLRVKHIEDLSYKWVLYGKVMSTLIDFFITAFLVFLVVRYAHISLAVK